ncbi:MAG: hypothetical protein HC914_16265 [Chloroflexaceae bacterium]|nr:hypothetical protein [Chloroflexaceae bacterium]
MQMSQSSRTPPPHTGPSPLNHALTKLAEVIDSIGGRFAVVVLLLGLAALLLYALGVLSPEQLQEWQRLLSGGA